MQVHVTSGHDVPVAVHHHARPMRARIGCWCGLTHDLHDRLERVFMAHLVFLGLLECGGIYRRKNLTSTALHGRNRDNSHDKFASMVLGQVVCRTDQLGVLVDRHDLA